MGIRKTFKLLGLLIAIVPFSSVACQKTSSSHNNPNPKYILTGTKDSEEGDYVYYSINSGTEFAVALKDTLKESTLARTIPSEYKSKPVTGIWRSGFADSKATSVTIPQGITVIDYEAFIGSKIETLTGPASVSQIGEAAFYSCKKITKAVFTNSSSASASASSACSCVGEEPEEDEGEKTYSTLSVIPSFCFFGCNSLKELVLPQAIQEIEYEAFNGCSALFSTLAFMNITAIRCRAFQNCTSLTKVYISDTFFDKENGVPVGIIEEQAFNGCSSSLKFYLVGDSDDVQDWLDLPRNVHWNWRDDRANPASSYFSYEVTKGGASYSNDWIYTVDNDHNIEISSYIGPTEIDGNPIEFLSIPDEIPSGSGDKVRTIALNALDSVKSIIKRLYLPKTLRRIGNSFFTSSYTNLNVIDLTTTCTADETLIAASQDLTPRIVLNGITDLEVIGNSAFIALPKLNTIKKLYLPYSLKAVGSRAFGSSGNNSYHLRKVTDFRWDYDDEKSALKVIGMEAFYKLGKDDGNKNLTDGGVHQGRYDNNGNEKYQLTTLFIPRTFKHFGITSDDQSEFELNAADTVNSGAFAASPLLSKVVFKGSELSKVRGATSSTTDDDVSDLILGAQTFAMNESLRTVVFEERLKKTIIFHTEGGTYKPTIGWSSGKQKNDFGGDPALQTIVLPNTFTTLRMQNYALQGNSRGVIYFSSTSSSNITGNTQAKYTDSISTPNPATNIAITHSNVREWRTIGDEGFYSNNCPGYCFATSTTNSATKNQNSFGLDQRMPMYENVLYKETVNAPGINGVEVEVGSSNTNEFVIKDKCAFVCNNSTNKATMTKYLYDRYETTSTFNGTAKVPATVTNSSSDDFTVNAIGDSAFSAAFCDELNSNPYSLTPIKNTHLDLTAVSLPDTIASIGDYAFMRAYGVTNVYSYNVSTDASNGNYVMPSSLTSIGKQAFAFCNVQQFLNIPLTCRFYENTHSTTTVTSVFSNNFSLRKITFGNNATSSTYYETTTYTHSGSATTYTSAIYSKSNVSQNKSTLLLVLYRDAADYLSTSEDLSEITSTNPHTNQFNGQYRSKFLYGAFKMGYWIDSLIVGVANNSSNQPLISGIYQFLPNAANNKDDYIYLNQPIYNFTENDIRLKTISFGASGILSVPPYSFEGCSDLQRIRLPRNVGATLPAGLFAYLDNEDVIFETPDDNTGESFSPCAAGELDLTYTGYSGIAAEAFKNSSITRLVAPITTDFTISQDAFAGCDDLADVDFSNVTDNVYLNASFRNTEIESNLFTWSSTADVHFGNETFKGCSFEDNSFTLPAKTKEIGESCFAYCTTLYNVSASANLTELDEIGDYAFHMCSKLTGFDFSKFTALERIGHYAFGMTDTLSNGKIKNDEAGPTNTASICASGIVDLPASLTTIGVGAFHSTHITKVIIRSTTMTFERGTSSGLLSYNKGGCQFRFCKELTEIFFTDPDCAWLTVQTGGQDNFFSDCGSSFASLYLPTGFGLDNAAKNSTMWMNESLVVYTYLTLAYTKAQNMTITSNWRKQNSSNKLAEIVYYVTTSDDLLDVNNNYQYLGETNKTQFWAIYQGNVVHLGKPTSIDSANRTVTFANGYTLTSSGLSHS